MNFEPPRRPQRVKQHAVRMMVGRHQGGADNWFCFSQELFSALSDQIGALLFSRTTRRSQCDLTVSKAFQPISERAGCCVCL